jgi:hypothetical protein
MLSVPLVCDADNPHPTLTGWSAFLLRRYYTDVRKYLPAIESFRRGQQIAWDSSSDSSGGGGGPTFGSLGQGTAQLTDAAAGGEAPAPAPAPQNAGDVPSNWGFVEGTEAADASVGWGQGALDQIMCQVFSNC